MAQGPLSGGECVGEHRAEDSPAQTLGGPPGLQQAHLDTHTTFLLGGSEMSSEQIKSVSAPEGVRVER